MNRLLAALGLAIVLVGCTASMTPSQPAPSPSPMGAVPSSTVGAQQPVTPTPAGLVAYGWGDHIWVVNADGNDAHELLPNVPGSQTPLAWSGDGSRLLYSRGTLTGLGLTDAAGSEPAEYDLECPIDADNDALLYACQADMGEGWGSVAISPDGTRLAYPIREGSHDQGQGSTNSIVVLELSTRLVTKLESTQTTTPTPTATCGTAADQGENHSPSWSPDGTRLIFMRDSAGADCQQAILIVNVDGSDLRQIVAPGQLHGVMAPSWSPDGSSILIGLFYFDDGTDIPKAFPGDIYIVGSDGTGLYALTSDGVSIGPSWTRDGRVAFIRWSSPTVSAGDNWVMDADGGNARQLEPTIPALTAAGCMICAYPMNSFDSGGSPIDTPEAEASPPLRMWETYRMLWQPVP